MEMQRSAAGEDHHLVRQKGRYRDGLAPERPADPESVTDYLSSFWNWTAMLGTRPLIKCGRVYSQKGTSGQFK